MGTQKMSPHTHTHTKALVYIRLSHKGISMGLLSDSHEIVFLGQGRMR